MPIAAQSNNQRESRMKISLVIVSADGTSRTETLDIANDSSLKDALLVARQHGAKTDYCKVWVDGEPKNDPAVNLQERLPHNPTIRIEEIARWEI
jgi:hypothetical protein